VRSGFTAENNKQEGTVMPTTIAKTFWVSLAGLSVLAAPARAADPAPQPAAAAPGKMLVYDKALGEGWQNWSWAKTELSLVVNGSTRTPIGVDAGAWQALYLHHEPFSTAGYRRLSMLIQGAAPGGHQLRILAIAGGKPVNADGKLVTLPASGWAKMEVPLTALGAGDKTIEGFWVQNATDKEVPRFYVTEVTLD
jgi:hypothetical protein